MKVECWALFGEWLQVRFEDKAAVWVMKESGGHQLLVRIESAIQRRIALEMTHSPCVLDPSKLVLREEDVDDVMLDASNSVDFDEDNV